MGGEGKQNELGSVGGAPKHRGLVPNKGRRPQPPRDARELVPQYPQQPEQQPQPDQHQAKAEAKADAKAEPEHHQQAEAEQQPEQQPQPQPAEQQPQAAQAEPQPDAQGQQQQPEPSHAIGLEESDVESGGMANSSELGHRTVPENLHRLVSLTEPTPKASHRSNEPVMYKSPTNQSMASSAGGAPRFALLVLNTQNDFFAGGSLMPADLDPNLGPRIAAFVDAAPWACVLYSHTSHPVNREAFVSVIPGSQPFTQSNLKSGEAIFVLPDYCVLGSHGAQGHPSVPHAAHSVVVESGLSADVEDIGPFSTLATLQIESVVDVLLEHVEATDLVVLGMDVDGESHLAALDALSDTSIRLHIARDLSHTLLESEAWQLCAEMGAMVESSDEILQSSLVQQHIAAYRHPPEHALINKLVEMAMGREYKDKALMDLVRPNTEALSLPHPMSGRFAIHYLSQIKSTIAISMLTKLLKEGLVDVKEESIGFDMNALMYACQCGNAPAVRLLLKHQPNLDHSDHYGRSAMIHAIQSRDPDTVRALLEHPEGGPRLLTKSDVCRRTTLMIACHFAGYDTKRPKHADQIKGMQVLDLLWSKFDKRAFLELQGDAQGWAFWNYAVRFNLTQHLSKAIKLFTHTEVGRADNEVDANELAEQESLHRESPTRLVIKEEVLVQIRQGQLRSDAATVAHLKAGKHTKSQFKIAEGKGKTIQRQLVLSHTINMGMNLLHQATWQQARSCLDMLLQYYQRHDLLQVTLESGMNALDLAAEDNNPSRAFALVKAGCVPKQKLGLPMYNLCVKAILLGQPVVVKGILMSDECSVLVDMQMLDLVSRAKFVRTCTSSMSSSASPFSQLAFRCGQCERQHPNHLYCAVCAAGCHAGHDDLVLVGIDTFHCPCSSTSGCVKKKGMKPFDSLWESIDRDAAEAKPGRMVHSIRFVADENSFGSPHSPGAPLASPASHRSYRMATPVMAEESSSANRPMRMKSFKRQATNLSEKQSQQDKDQPASLSFRDYVRVVFLMSASKNGKEGVLEELVKRVEPDSTIDLSMDRPLHLAARSNNVAACVLLKKRGGRAALHNKKGETPLHIAAAYGHEEVCEVLAHSSNVLRMDALGLTPLHQAVRNDHPKVVQFLAFFLRHRSKVPVEIDLLYFNPVRDNSDPAPPRLAHRNSFIRRSAIARHNICDISMVADKVKKLEAGECEGHASPLHLAVRYGHVRCAQILIHHGASPIFNDATTFSPYQTGIWEQYLARRMLEHHHSSLPRTRKEGEGESGKMTRRRKSQFFVGGRLTEQGRDAQRQFGEVKRRIPHKDRPLDVHVSHELLDGMGRALAVERSRTKFAYQHLFKWVFAYLMVLVLFMTFAIPRVNDRYLMGRMMEGAMDRSGFNNITNTDEGWAWFDTHLRSNLTLVAPTLQDQAFTGVRVLGAVRLRQVRSRDRLCHSPSFSRGLDGIECVPRRMGAGTESRDVLEWDPDVSDLALSSDNSLLLETARVWRRGEGEKRILDFGEYWSGGYYVDLDLQQRSDADNAALLQALQRHDAAGNAWIDASTRFVEVAFSVYNANLNMFGVLSLTLECGATGEVMPDVSVRCFTLEQDILGTNPSVGFKFATGLVFVFMACNVGAMCIRVGFRFFRKSGTWFDAIVALFALALFVLDVVVSSRVHNHELNFDHTAEYHPSLQVTALILESQSYVIAGTILMLWLRLVKYSVLFPRFGRVTYAFMNTIRNFEVLSYLLFMLFVIVGFMCAYSIAFSQVERTSSYLNSFNLLMQLTMGEWSELVFAQLPDIIGTVLFIAFMISVAVVFINLFISVLSEVYPHEKEQAVVQCNDNLTGLMQHEFILATHPKLAPPAGATAVRTHVHSNLVVPALTSVGVVLRLFNQDWNFDVPKKEFGWEKGRGFYRQKLAPALEEEEF